MWQFDSIIVYANAFPFVSLLFFLVFVYNNPVFDQKQSKFFMFTGCVTLFMIIIITFDFIFAQSGYLNNTYHFIYILRRMTSFINFAISPIIPMAIFHIFAKGKIKYFYYIPAVVNAIICFISMFNGCVFNISYGNFYNRGTIFMIPFAITILYLILLIIQSCQISTKSKKSERLFLLWVVAILCACMYLEVMHQFSFLTWDFTSICLILYYLLLNIHRTIIDPLTGVYNRLAYMKELSRIDKYTSCIIAIIDINNFKDVNDTRGHDAGDTFLQEFTLVLEHAFLSTSSIYRIGGDEFIVLSKKFSDEQFEAALQRATLLAQQRDMYFACGWKRYNKGYSLDEFQVQIDQLMYANKKTNKERNKQDHI